MNDEILDEITDEAIDADVRYGPFRSSHEGFGVLTEEYHELLDAIHANDALAIRREAIQVSAVALRIAESMRLKAARDRSGIK